MNRIRAGMDSREWNRNLIVRGFLVLCLCIGVICHTAWSQVGSAALGGVVQDATGAVVVGASVTLQNDGSGAQRISSSNGSGSFSFEAVPSGDYTLTIEQKGFKQLIRQSIHLNPGDSQSLTDLKLAVGATTESV